MPMNPMFWINTGRGRFKKKSFLILSDKLQRKQRLAVHAKTKNKFAKQDKLAN
jgi:hypothetical protein